MLVIWFECSIGIMRNLVLIMILSIDQAVRNYVFDGDHDSTGLTNAGSLLDIKQL